MSFETLAGDNTLLGVMVRFLINLTVLIILIRFIYYKFTKKEEFVFSYFLMGIIIFLLCSLLETVNIQLGMALGLFAVFAILRFRTVNYTTKDMTYVFTVIGISVINSQAFIPPPFLGALVINIIIIITAIILESFNKKNTHTQAFVVFNNLKLLDPLRKDELLKELTLQTGLNIEKITINKIDIAKGNAVLMINFRE